MRFFLVSRANEATIEWRYAIVGIRYEAMTPRIKSMIASDIPNA